MGMPETCPARSTRAGLGLGDTRRKRRPHGPGRAGPTDELQEVLVERGREDMFLEQNSSRGAGRSHSDVLTVRVRDSGV